MEAKRSIQQIGLCSAMPILEIDIISAIRWAKETASERGIEMVEIMPYELNELKAIKIVMDGAQ